MIKENQVEIVNSWDFADAQEKDEFRVDLLTRTVVDYLAVHGTIDREQLTGVLLELHDAADTPRLDKAKIRGVLRGLEARYEQ